jgi:hypothetical protein
MVNRSASRPFSGTTRRATFRQTTPRHFWLAALGAAAVARRKALVALDDADLLRQAALRRAADAHDIALGAVITVQETVGPRIEAQMTRLGAGIGPRLAPLFERRDAKPAARRPARTIRRPAPKKAGQRSSGARTKAATRVKRKGRG